MEELARWLLTLESAELSIPGLLLAFIALAAVGLYREWWVPGPRWREKVAAAEKLEAALAACNAAVKRTGDEHVEARIEIVRLRAERESGRWRTEPRPPRESG